MEHGIKSPSLSKGCQGSHVTLGLMPAKADTTGVRRQQEVSLTPSAPRPLPCEEWKPWLIPDTFLKCFSAQPTRGTTTDGKWGDTFRARECNDPRQEASKAMVMEHGIKSPSRGNGSQGCRATLGLMPAQS